MDLESGVPIAFIKSKHKDLDNQILYINEEMIDDKKRKEVVFDTNTELRPLPIINLNGEKQNTRMFISGPSGSGKSFFTKQFLKQYMKLYENKKIYYISRLNDDEAFNGIEMKKINCNKDEILEYEPESFKNSLIIMDDFEMINDKEKLEHTYHIRNTILECGRHMNTDIIIVSHQLLNNQKTKLVHFESNLIVLFPKSNFNPIKKYLKSYVEDNKQLFNKIKNLKSRWVLLRKSYPLCFIHENGAFLI